MARHFLITLITVAVLACTPRGEFTRVADLPTEVAAEVPRTGVTETIFVGTTRLPEGRDFGFGRADTTRFLRYDIHVPKDREVGDLSWPGRLGNADPATDFLTRADQEFASSAEFRASVASALASRGQKDVVVYVHGFNNTMAEGIYRVAQMHHDLKVPGVAVHYAWPSRGSALGYVYDRESALFGRDGLEELLDEVTAAGARRVVIVAHSMGAALTMETLRQAAFRGDGRVLSHIGGVVLISPDLDLDVFRSLAHGVGTLPQPFLIFGNRKDTVLGLSSRIAGNPERLGNLTDLGPIADLDVTYLDTAAFDVGAGHLNLGNSPALIQLLGGIGDIDAAFRADAAGRVGLLPGVVLTVKNATSIILAPVEAVAKGGRRP